MDVLKMIAEKMNGAEYRNELSDELESIAKSNGVVIAFGASDDLCVLRGAVDDEVSCYNGGHAYFNKKGLLQNKCDDEDCPYFEAAKARATALEIVWCPKYVNGDVWASWAYLISVPHEKFNIMEDGGLYCEGICFYLKDCAMLNINFATTRLREITYPTTLLDAAAAWNCSPSTARTRLGAAIGAGLVMYAGKREDRLYSPTLKLLNLMMEAI